MMQRISLTLPYSLFLLALICISGCDNAIRDFLDSLVPVNVTPPVETALAGDWILTYTGPQQTDSQTMLSSRDVDLGFWRLSKIGTTDYENIYQVSHPCQPDVIIAYMIVYNDGSVEIESASGESYSAGVLVNRNLVTGTMPIDDSSWTMERIESPPCTQAGVDELMTVDMHEVELSGEAQGSPEGDGMAHLEAAANSRLSAVEPYYKKDSDNEFSCSGDGSTSIGQCDTSGGHPGYIECSSQRVSEAKIEDLESVVALLDTNEIYPGALIQGDSFDGGSYTPITIPRAGGTITLEGLSSSQGSFTRTVDEITHGKVSEAISSMLQQNSVTGTAADFGYHVETAYSKHQWAFALGTDVKFMGNAISGALDTGNESEENQVIMRFTQVYYTVSFADPTYRYSVFKDGRLFHDPENQIGKGNPPLYVSNVKYGRQIFLFARSKYATNYVKGALEYAYKGVDPTTEVSVNSNISCADVMANTSVTYVVRGGDAAAAVKPITADTQDKMFEAVRSFIADATSSTWSLSSPGLPVAYTLRYLQNRRVAQKGYTTTYNKRDCRMIQATASQFSIEAEDVDDNLIIWAGLTADAAKLQTPVYESCERTMPRTSLNQWIPATTSSYTLVIAILNNGCGPTGGIITFYRDGQEIERIPYTTRSCPHCWYSLEAHYTVNPTTGEFTKTYFQATNY